MRDTETTMETAMAARPRVRRRPGVVIGMACTFEWLVPGTGYLLLGRIGTGIAVLLALAFLFGWGLALDGRLDRPEAGSLLSYPASAAAAGAGAAYFVVLGSDRLGRGLGDVTSGSFEYGTTFLRMVGLVGFLLILDVFDIGMGRR